MELLLMFLIRLLPPPPQSQIPQIRLIMKKKLFQLAILLLSLPCVASNYRGMFELNAGPIFANEVISTTTGKFKYDKTSFAGMFSTSHGCQFTPSLFAGGGAGIICDWNSSDNNSLPESTRPTKNHLINIPFFVDLRWDQDINRKWTPYADLRIGYQLGMDGYVLYKAQSTTNSAYSTAGWMKSADGFFMQLSAGVRCKVGESTGINLGLTYSPFIRREILIGGTLHANRNFLAITVGIDLQAKGQRTAKESRKDRLYRLQQRQLKKKNL